MADTNVPDADELPPLRPPRPEIPLSFWQQHETSLVIGGALLIVVVGAGAWWLMRPKPPVIEPPAVTARQALDILRNQMETGLVLMKVSQVLRSYFAAVYRLPRGEFTTTEFACIMVSKGTVDSQLAAAVSDFLKQCDQRKFAPTAGPQLPLGAVARAAKLIDQAEAARTALAPQPAIT